jgi:DNA-binding transcriptional MerR regulator
VSKGGATQGQTGLVPGLAERAVTGEVQKEKMPEEGFSSTEAMRFTGCSYNQLRYWDRIGLVRPSIKGTRGTPGVRRIYDLRDLVALRVIKRLIDNGMSLQRIQRAWKYLRRVGDLDQHISQAGLFLDAFGTTILAPHPESRAVMDALTNGQFVFIEVLGEVTDKVEDDHSHFEFNRAIFRRMLNRVYEDFRDNPFWAAGG